eukprot:tig00020960_g16582.t1
MSPSSRTPQRELRYRLKRVVFIGKRVSILLQNENGPCPLLAVANVLLLRGVLSIHGDVAFISHDELLSLVGEHLLVSNNVDRIQDPERRENQRANLQDVISNVLPKLASGLDVNVKFNSIKGFELTAETMIFDLLDVNLVHGWLVDPQETDRARLVLPLSYNQLVERIVALSATPRPGTAPPKPEAATGGPGPEAEASGRGGGAGGGDGGAAAGGERAQAGGGAAEGDAEAQARELWVLQDWLASTGSQLTYHGLIELHTGVKELELVVFFRNNHFATLFRQRDALFLLVTDEGYYNSPIVWERLEMVEGDNPFLNEDFSPYSHEQANDALAAAMYAADLQGYGEGEERRGGAGEAPQPPPQQQPGPSPPASGHLPTNVVSISQEEADFAMAVRLQEEEEARQRQAAMNRRQQQQQQQQQAGQPPPQPPPPEAQPPPQPQPQADRRSPSSQQGQAGGSRKPANNPQARYQDQARVLQEAARERAARAGAGGSGHATPVQEYTPYRASPAAYPAQPASGGIREDEGGKKKKKDCAVM